MNDVSRMHKIDSAQQLVKNELDHLLSEWSLLGLNQPFQGVLHVLHTKVHFIKLIFVLDFDDILQSDNITVL